jgi:hypothetical protein
MCKTGNHKKVSPEDPRLQESTGLVLRVLKAFVVVEWMSQIAEESIGRFGLVEKPCRFNRVLN